MLHCQTECGFPFFLAEALAFHTQINTVASSSGIIMSFPHTCSDNFMKSLHPNQLRRKPAFSQECTGGCGHGAHQGISPVLEQQDQDLPSLECKNWELLHLTYRPLFPSMQWKVMLPPREMNTSIGKQKLGNDPQLLFI